MNIILAFAAVIYCCAGEVPHPTRTYKFDQKIDHFSNSEFSRETFPQRVFEYDRFWKCGENGTVGPLFVYTGNEGGIDGFYYNTGFMFDIAPKFGALLVFIEHRLVYCGLIFPLLVFIEYRLVYCGFIFPLFSVHRI